MGAVIVSKRPKSVLVFVVRPPFLGGSLSCVSYSDQHAFGVHGTPIAHGASVMRSAFQVTDHVSWNSEARRVQGVIKKRLIAPTKLKGYTVRADKDEPQYLIVGDETGHLAVHKGSALRKLRHSVPAKAKRGPR